MYAGVKNLKKDIEDGVHLVWVYSISRSHKVHLAKSDPLEEKLPMQPYSIDFRQKIIEVRKQENISIRKLALAF